MAINASLSELPPDGDAPAAQDSKIQNCWDDGGTA
jgi:hypothetical protein